MFKKLFTLVLCFVCTTVFANSKNEFKDAIHSLNYELTVEWDQEDKTVFTRIMSDFQQKIAVLKAQGLSDIEIKASVLEMIKDPKVRSQIEVQATLLNYSSNEDLSNFIWKKSGNFYASGASWNGDVVLHVAFWTVMAGLIAWLVYNTIHPQEYMCTEYSEHYCEMREQCDSYTTDSEGYSSCDSYSDYEWCGTSCLNGYTYRK